MEILSKNRLDIFDKYNEKHFEKQIVKYGKIKNIYGITGSSRKLYECFST
tara:strand:- start:592 stop:741 length:150 start_codon:yes stop_codon:yes gene_type:complete